MTIEQTDKVDFISEDTDGNINLTISDHLEWDEDMEHLHILQNKINKYLAFIESGEIYEYRTNAKAENIIISVVCKYKPNNIAEEFLQKSKAAIENAGFKLKWGLLSEQ